MSSKKGTLETPATHVGGDGMIRGSQSGACPLSGSTPRMLHENATAIQKRLPPVAERKAKNSKLIPLLPLLEEVLLQDPLCTTDPLENGGSECLAHNFPRDEDSEI